MKRSRETEEDCDQSSNDGQDVAHVPVSKIVSLDVDSNIESNINSGAPNKCSLPGHAPGLSFASYKDYESHYNRSHTNRCLECRKNFPSSHILELHIEECHDALVEIRKEKGEPIYACFVESCDEKFETHRRRESHLRKNHMYPDNYFFTVTKFGIDRRQSMLVERNDGKPQVTQHRGSRPLGQKADNKDSKNVAAGKDKGGNKRDRSANEGQETAVVDTEMEDLSSAMSSLKFVPRTVRFGPKQRAGFAR